LKAGDVVIVDGVARLMPGAPIKLAGPAGAPPATPAAPVGGGGKSATAELKK
jgi:hypothetical protein